MAGKKIFNSGYRYDIALEDGISPRLVCWVTALMVFFATIALAVNFALSAMTQDWMTGLAGSVTVEVKPPAPSDNGAVTDETRRKFEDDAAKVLDITQKHPAVSASRLLPNDEVKKLVEPWLGRKMPADMQLPALIDIKLVPAGNLGQLQVDIRKAVPSAVIDTHDETLQSVGRLADTIRMFALILTGTIVALAVISTVGIVRAKFFIHRQEVETLHLIGADDEYIAAQFRRHTLRGTLQGAALGLMGTVMTLLVTALATRTVDSAIVPQLNLNPLQWCLLALSPVVAGSLVAHFAAQGTVMRELAKMP
jgi:cell division transport system permease protein